MDDDVPRVVLRPVAEADLELLERLTNDPGATGEHQWFGWHDPGYLRRRWQETGLLTAETGMLVPMLGGRVLGLVSWHRSRTGPASYCWNAGLVLAPDARGPRHGTQAPRPPAA